jgi:ribosome maturation protein Sdo1
MYDGASKATLENEFGTANEEECIMQILEKGEIQESEVRGLMFRLFDF